MKKLTIFLLLGFLFAGCNKDETEAEVFARNITEIEAYLADNNITAEMSETGLFYTIIESGGSEHPIVTSTVNVDYVGRTLAGDLFDSNEDISFGLNQVILGWTEGLQYIGKDGEIDLYIPARLGYGQNPPPNSAIEPGGVITFNVKLNSFN